MEVYALNRETLTFVLGNMCAFKNKQAKEVVMDAFDMVAEKRKVKSTFKELLSEDTFE